MVFHDLKNEEGGSVLCKELCFARGCHNVLLESDLIAGYAACDV